MKGGYSVNAIPSFPLHPRGSHGCSSPTSTTRNDLPVLPTFLQNTEFRAHGTSTSHKPNIYSEQFHYSNWSVLVLPPPPNDGVQNEEVAAFGRVEVLLKTDLAAKESLSSIWMGYACETLGVMS
jgi:hypothetical protein